MPKDDGAKKNAGKGGAPASLEEIKEENDKLRSALITLISECCDASGALLRPSKAAIKKAALAIGRCGS